MLIRVWRWMRGFDAWPEAQAHVTEALPIAGTDGSDDYCRISFWYRDGGGQAHDGWFTVREKTELYAIRPGECFPVQYDPAQPARYHARGVESTRLRIALNWLVFVAAVLVILLFAEHPRFGD